MEKVSDILKKIMLSILLGIILLAVALVVREGLTSHSYLAALVVGAKAIDAAVEGYEYAVGIDHTHRTNVFVADGIFSDRRNAGIFGRLLYGSYDLNVVSVLSVNTQHLNEYSLTGAEMKGCVHQALIIQFSERNKGFNAEEIYEDKVTYEPARVK